MGLVDAVKAYYKNYVKFSGRSTRSEYWWVQLYEFVVGLILAIPIFGAYTAMVQATMNGAEPDISSMFSIWWLPPILFALVNLIPSISLQFRRFQDRNQPGWLAFIMFALYVLGVITGIVAFIWLIALIAMAINFMMRGTVGPNKYGPDPLGNNTDVFS